MRKHKKIGLIIPAYNEEKTLAGVVAKASKYGIPIVVDDASTDATAKVAENEGAVVVSHVTNLGYDKALNSGCQKALEIGCVAFITLDADGQHDPELLSIFIDKLNEGYELVLGVRHKLPRMAEMLFSFYSKRKFGISDPCCGMKGYSIELYREKGVFDTYHSIGTELAFFGVINEYRYVEVPFCVNDRVDKARFGNSIKANYRILKAIIKSIFRDFPRE